MQQHGIRRPPLLKVYSVQLLFLIVVSAFCALMFDRALALSLLAGGLTAFIPNAYFAKHAFKYAGASAAAAVTASFYRGEAGKFLMTVVMFACIFVMLKPLVAWAVFAAYLMMWVANVASAAWINKRRSQ